MAFPIALIPVAIAAIRGLVNYRKQLDSIFVEKQTTAGLPYLLPPAPTNISVHIAPMRDFLQTARGKSMLGLAGLDAQFNAYLQNPDGFDDAQVMPFVRLYLETQNLALEKAGPQWFEVRPGSGRVNDAQWAYFMVSSHRLSRNPAFTRVVLATADALLEFGGAAAPFLISNPKTAALVETLLVEFAAKRDLSDAGGEELLRALLGSAVVASLENQQALPDHPALTVLFAALADMRTSHPDDFIMRIVTADGFQQAVSFYLTHAATDPKFVDMAARISGADDLQAPELRLVKAAFATTLGQVGNNLANLLDDPRALAGVLQAALASAAANVDGVLASRLPDGTPLLAGVLAAVAHEIETTAAGNALFAELANGDLLASVYRVSLAAVAADPRAVAQTGDLDPTVGKLVSAMAGVLAGTSLEKLKADRGAETVRLLASRTLEVFGAEPEFLIARNAYGAKVLGGVLAASAALVRDGLQIGDVMPVAEAALDAAAGNLALVEMDAQIRVVIESFGLALADDAAKKLLTPRGRRDALIGGVQAVAANPAVWKGLGEAKLVQPLVVAFLEGAASDPTGLLSGPVLVQGLRKSLVASARHGGDWLAKADSPAMAKAVLEALLADLQQRVGKSVDRETLPDYLEQVFVGYGKDWFKPTGAGAKTKLETLFKDSLA